MANSGYNCGKDFKFNFYKNSSSKKQILDEKILRLKGIVLERKGEFVEIRGYSQICANCGVQGKVNNRGIRK